MTRVRDSKGFIWIGLDGGRASIRGYSATSKGTTTIVKIEVEVFDPAALGDLLRDLGEARMPPKPKARLLAITDQRGRP